MKYGFAVAITRVISWMPNGPVSIDRYLRSGASIPASTLQQIYEQRQKLEIVRRILPDSLADSLSGCVRKPAELVLLTESPAAASQLRFFSPVLQETLNARGGIKIESVKIRIVPPAKAALPRRPARKVPSLETVRVLRECSEFFSGTDLEISLNRLADTLARTNSS